MYIISCAPKLARKYEIEHWSRFSKTINWPEENFQINHVTSMSWQMSPRYGQWLSCFDSCQLTILWILLCNLVLNVSKTKRVLFTSQRHKERDCILNLNLLGKSISCETTFKYLGVVFDNFMTWKAHADYVCKKVASRVSILGRVRSFVTKEAATQRRIQDFS